ncbi:MAG: hypothetical protein AB7G75_09580 [Candidatus Binatia bacterium]
MVLSIALFVVGLGLIIAFTERLVTGVLGALLGEGNFSRSLLTDLVSYL